MLVIRNIEPLAQNREALGFDVAQEITRRTAARRAIYSGALSMTGSVTLVQDAARSPGFLLFLPAYREGQSPYQPDGQPATLVGLLYAPVVAGELLGSVRQATQSHLDFDLFDGSSTEEGDRVYADRLPHQDTAPAPRSAQRTLKVGGRLLTLSTRSTPAFDALQDRSSLAIAGVGGAGLSLLAALATWLLAAGQLRAQNLARRMTHDLDRLARVVQHTHNAVAITDADGVIAWVNAGFSRILGYDGDRVRGSSLLSYVSTHDSDQGTLRELLQQVQRGTAARGELRLRCQDGSNVWMDTELQPVLDAQGTVTGFMAIATDITQQKQAQLQMEAAMREASTLLATFEAHAIVSVTDRSGTITQVNDAFCAISGYSAEESLGANHRIVNSGTHPAAFWEAMWADIAAGQSWRADVCNRAKDGRLYWVDSIITPFVGDDGLVERYVSIRNDITPRKTAELRLREMSERMALAIEGSSDGVWDWMDVSASAQWWSPSYYALLGYSPQELPATSENFLALVHPEHLARCQAAVRASLEHGAVFDLELQLRTRDRGYRWFRTRAKVTPGSAAQTRRMAGSTQDVHERKLAQAELAHTNDRFALATQSAGIGVWEWEVGTRVLGWDARMYGLYGYDADTPVPALDILLQGLDLRDRARFEDCLRQAIVTRSGFSGDFRVRWPNGELHHIRAAARAVLGGDNRVAQLIGVNFDITAIVSAQEALAANEAFLERVGRVAGVGGWRVDLADQRVTWSALTRAIHEVDEDYVPQLATAIAFYAPEARPIIEAAVQQGMAHGTPWDLELPFTTAKGRPIWVRAVGEVEFAEGQPVALIGAFQDITRRREQEQALRDAVAHAEQASLAKGQFLANMSHEIRTPMNAIIGMLKLLHNTELTVQQLDYADKSQGAAVALLGLINDILDFSKIEAGKMTLDPQPLQLETLLRDLGVILSANVQNKGIEILYDIAADLPACVVCDGMRLQQVLINLGGNAIKFTQQGQVVVSVQVLQRSAQTVQLQFSVQDSGIGIAPEHQSRIFAGFSQAEASTTRKFGGTGLGLAISQRLVTLMGGALCLESHPGVGSTFRFALELELCADTHPGPHDAAADSPRTALVVDDNPIARALLVQMVQSWGWTVCDAPDGASALHAVQARAERAFDVVYVDWAMPAMDGWETVARLRAAYAQRGWAQAHVVMVSAYGRDLLAQRTVAEQASVDAYVVKPLTAAMLRDASLHPQGQARLRDPQRGPASQRRLQGLRLLVVEDNLINQQVAEELLASEGARVALAANGQLGVEAVAAAQPQFDAVLMDLQMPVMDGYTATRTIRNSLGLRELPIIAMTANAMASDREECLAVGMSEHVGKPFDLDQLVRTLLRVTGYQPPAPGAPAPQEPLGPALHDVGGLQVQTALARMGGMQALYLRTARDFQAALPAVMPQLRQSMASDRALAAMQAHTLKGNAGTLGAEALSAAAAQLEKLLKSDAATVSSLEHALDVLGHAVTQALHDLGVLLGNGGAVAPASEALPAPEYEVLQTLGALAADEDFAALEYFAQHREALQGLAPHTLQVLEEALQGLDFGAASACCAEQLSLPKQ